MGKGESFGEQALYYNTKRQCTIRALGDVNIYLKCNKFYYIKG